jgi:3-mercaptopyruvate sulfurtransferase SseA
MKKFFIFAFVMVFTLTVAGFAVADDSEMLQANEKKAWENATKAFPAERQLNVQQFKELYDKVMAGKEDAYLIDLRTHPEFYAGHIAGTNHIHAGHMYTFPKKSKTKTPKSWCGAGHTNAGLM